MSSSQVKKKKKLLYETVNFLEGKNHEYLTDFLGH